MDLYRNDVRGRNLRADYLRHPKLSNFFNTELLALLGDPEATAVVASVVRSGNFSSEYDLREQQREVSEVLFSVYGVKGGRGKRPRAGLAKLVETMAPVLVYYGLPAATNERSKLVRSLRLIADEVGVVGDPRNELRRLKRIDDRSRENVRKAYQRAFIAGLSGAEFNPMAKN